MRLLVSARLHARMLTVGLQKSTKKAVRSANKANAAKDAARDKKRSQVVKANASKDAARKKSAKEDKAGRAKGKKKNT